MIRSCGILYFVVGWVVSGVVEEHSGFCLDGSILGDERTLFPQNI